MSPEEPAPRPVHRPVLVAEVIAGLEPKPGAVIVDGTAGAGGHSRVLAELVGPSGRVIGLDRDPEMIALAEEATRGLPVTLIHASYSELDEVLDDLEIDAVDGILLDLGLSSDQLAWGHRGFSFSEDAPLDMRFDPRTEDTAADLVNSLSTEELADLFYQYGEERHSRRVARRIVEERRVEPIRTTGRLAQIVRKSIPGKWGPIDPATRVFQALRIAVNDELVHLDAFLANLAGWLKPGGRAAILSFHSLEDRRVKHGFRDDPDLTVLTRKPITATAEEVRTNPRGTEREIEGGRAMHETHWQSSIPELVTPPGDAPADAVASAPAGFPGTDSNDSAPAPALAPPAGEAPAPFVSKTKKKRRLALPGPRTVPWAVRFKVAVVLSFVILVTVLALNRDRLRFKPKADASKKEREPVVVAIGRTGDPAPAAGGDEGAPLPPRVPPPSKTPPDPRDAVDEEKPERPPAIPATVPSLVQQGSSSPPPLPDAAAPARPVGSVAEPTANLDRPPLPKDDGGRPADASVVPSLDRPGGDQNENGVRKAGAEVAEDPRDLPPLASVAGPPADVFETLKAADALAPAAPPALADSAPPVAEPPAVAAAPPPVVTESAPAPEPKPGDTAIPASPAAVSPPAGASPPPIALVPVPALPKSPPDVEPSAPALASPPPPSTEAAAPAKGVSLNLNTPPPTSEATTAPARPSGEATYPIASAGASRSSGGPSRDPTFETPPGPKVSPASARRTPEAAGEPIEALTHVVQRGENFWTIAKHYYGSGRFYKALWDANKDRASAPEDLYIGTPIRIPPLEDLRRDLIITPSPSRSAGASRTGSADATPPKGKGSTRDEQTSRVSRGSTDSLRALPAGDVTSSADRPASDPSDRPSSRARRVYVVKAHETLRSIAHGQLGDSDLASEIESLNQEALDDAGGLKIGMRLKLPDGSKKE